MTSIHDLTSARIQALAGSPSTTRVQAAASTSGSRESLHLYEPIGGWFGVSAADVVDALQGIDAETIELHLNSPGGDVFDGIAIMNALKQHQATVEVHVDGLAASIASVIALAGDTIVMHPGAQLMIHDASGLCFGNAADMGKMADDLDHVSATIASLYAGRAGGSVDDWRQAMLDETWYDPAEAVQAGLADKVADDQADDEQAATNRWDLTVFAHAGRDRADRPFIPAGGAAAVAAATGPCPNQPGPAGPGSTTPDASGDTTQEGSTDVEFTDEQLTTLRQRVGVPVDADADTILGALDEALEERADSQVSAGPPDGMVLMDEAQHAQLLDDAAAGRAAREQQLADRREDLVAAAIQDGRIPVARREHWIQALAADPEGNEQVLESLAPGLVNTVEHGHASPESGDASDKVYAAMYGDEEAK